MKTHRPRVTALIILAASFSLSGCGPLAALQGEPRRDVFDLRAPSTPTGCSRASIDELVIEMPKTRGTLDTERIMIRPSPLQTQYLPDAEWGDTAPEMLQRILVQSLGTTGSFSYVGRVPLGPGGDYAMLSEIMDFNAELSGGEVVVRLAVSLQMVRELDATVVSKTQVAAAFPAGSTRTADLVPAFDSGMRQVVMQITDWSLRAANVDPSRCRGAG